METIYANSYEKIMELRTNFNYKYQNEVLFRGTSNRLIPSLTYKCSYNTPADLALKEQMLLKEFETFISSNYQFKNDFIKDWEIRIAAREHGLASSLMDWSNDINIAVEFAIHNFEEKNIESTNVWILVKSGIMQIELDEFIQEVFQDNEQPSILNYHLNVINIDKAYSRRKSIQGGFFLKQPYTDIVTELYQNPALKNNLIKIIIPKKAVSEIRSSLSEIIDLSKTAMPSANLDETEEIMDKVSEQLNVKYA